MKIFIMTQEFKTSIWDQNREAAVRSWSSSPLKFTLTSTCELSFIPIVATVVYYPIQYYYFGWKYCEPSLVEENLRADFEFILEVLYWCNP